MQPMITTVTQIYEWESIITIILKQKGKFFGQVLEEMKDKSIKSKFKTKEIIHRGFYVFTVILLMGLGIGLNINNKGSQDTIFIDIFDVCTILVIAALIISIYRLRKYMKIFHDDKYDEQKKALWLYFILEVVAYTIMLAFDILMAVMGESREAYSLKNLINYSIHLFFPTI
jgi:hypothetical protein